MSPFQGQPGENGEKGRSVYITGGVKGIQVSFMAIVRLTKPFSQ
jgi:hypothetical protein